MIIYDLFRMWYLSFYNFSFIVNVNNLINFYISTTLMYYTKISCSKAQLFEFLLKLSLLTN